MANVIIEAPVPAREASPRPRTAVLDVSILIVTWNSERWIDRCLRSIPAACEGLRYEVVVHDNASSDGTLETSSVVETLGLVQARVIRSAVNAGFGAGTNRAFSESTGRYVFLLNPDCELVPGALTLLVEFLDAHPQVAAAAPLLLEESGQPQREFQLRRLPTLRSFATEVLLIDKVFPRNATTARYRYRDLDLTSPVPVEQPAAAALLLRRTDFERIGGFDEQFAPAWFEDVDLCRRLADAGKEIWVVPDSRVRHFGGASLEHVGFAEFADIWYGNMWRYARKWMRPSQAEALRLMIIAGMILRCFAFVVGLHPPGVSRRVAFRACRRVLRRAFDRWDG